MSENLTLIRLLSRRKNPTLYLELSFDITAREQATNDEP